MCVLVYRCIEGGASEDVTGTRQQGSQSSLYHCVYLEELG